MPLVFSATAVVGKKKMMANELFKKISGTYTSNDVVQAVGKRQDQQKYVRQHIRAKEFIRCFPAISLAQLEYTMEVCYNRKKWGAATDIKKVYYHTN